MSSAPPVPKEIKDVLKDVLGRDVLLSGGAPVGAADPTRMLVALYVGEGLRLTAVVGMDIPLAAYAGAAYGRMSQTTAKACVNGEALSTAVAENATEVCTMLSTLFARPDGPHVRMYQVILPGEEPPADAATMLLAPGRRRDLVVDVTGFGRGRFAVAVA